MKRVKNWLVVPSLALVIVVLLALPGVAYAQPPEKDREFTATGELTVTYLPDPYPKGPKLLPKLLQFEDEVAVGAITSCDGCDFLGAEFYTMHTSLARVDWSTYDTEGVLHGTFTLELGGDVLSGRLRAKQQGNLISGPIVSTGKWNATERTGIFKQVFPAGEWQSTVWPVYEEEEIVSWTGTFTWQGKSLISLTLMQMGNIAKKPTPILTRGGE